MIEEVWQYFIWGGCLGILIGALITLKIVNWYEKKGGEDD